MSTGPARTGLALGTLLLVTSALVGCAGEPAERVQHVAFCPAPDPAEPDVTRVAVEFRLDETVVASASVGVGSSVTVEVPLGRISIWADGVEQGSAESGQSATDEGYEPPLPTDMIYLRSGEGCPDVAAPYGSG